MSSRVLAALQVGRMGSPEYVINVRKLCQIDPIIDLIFYFSSGKASQFVPGFGVQGLLAGQ